MRKLKILLVLIFPCTLLFSQITISGKIIDNENNKPIQYANITIPNIGLGILSDALGNFSIKTHRNISNDSLVISSIGYKELNIIVRDLKKKNNIIKLEKRVYNFSEITIHDRDYINNNIGARKKKRKSTFNNCTKVNMQVALYIEPYKYDKNAFLKNVKFYISSKGVYYTPFRVRIYDVDTITKQPNKDILYNEVIVQAQKANSWVNVNLEGYNILLPENGFFVSMEWLYVEGKAKYLRGRSPNRKKMCFGQRLAMTNEFKKNLTWTKIAGIKWVPINSFPSQKKILNAAIGIIVSQQE